MNTPRVLLYLVASVLCACSRHWDPLSPVHPQAGDGLLTIQTEKGAYTWTEVSLETGAGIRAPLINTTDRTFYAQLGDRYAGIDQTRLFIAEGSDGFLEQLVPPSSWRRVPRVVFVEGVRTIAIRPSTTYTLLGQVPGSKTTGTFQLRVEYFDQPERQPSSAAHRDWSNIFVIQ